MARAGRRRRAAAWSLSRTTAAAKARDMREPRRITCCWVRPIWTRASRRKPRSGPGAEGAGGRQPSGRGYTQNALLSLGDRQYHNHRAGSGAIHIQLSDRSPEARGAAARDMGRFDAGHSRDVVSRARAAGFGVFGPRDGSRVRPDGVTLKWRSAGVQAGLGGSRHRIRCRSSFNGQQGSVHPSADAPAGCRLGVARRVASGAIEAAGHAGASRDFDNREGRSADGADGDARDTARPRDHHLNDEPQ